MKEKWLVICGLIRDEKAFAQNLEVISKWKADGQIHGVVVSTWQGELDSYPEIRLHLEANLYTIVELTPPILKTVGHTFHQAKTVHYGLQATPEGCMVLKMRPDMGRLPSHFMADTVALDLEIKSPSSWPAVLNKKIVCAEASVDSPYYINDIIYYGTREDLLKLANFDLSSEVTLVNTAPEQFFFRGAFANRIPILDAYLQVYIPYFFDQPDQAIERINILQNSDFYLDVFSTYIRFLHHYFRLSFAGEDERRAQPQIEEGFDVAGLLHGDAGLVGTRRHPGALAAVFGDERPVHAFLDGRFAENELGKRMRAALQRTSDPRYWATFSNNPLRPDARLAQFRSASRKAFPGLMDRIAEPSSSSHLFRVQGPAERMGLIHDTDEVASLSAEINRLRRHVEHLTRELAQKAHLKESAAK